jgi:Kef-type K+ transport system membrane component KefB
MTHSPFALFIVQVGLIIGASRVVGLAARRISQPMVIAEVVAGILLGPSLLGWIAPGALAVVFPKESMALLNVFSQVGLVMFMFLIGLELDPKLLRGRGHTSVFISHTSILVPCLLGAILGLWMYPRVSSPAVPVTSFVLFMAIAMSVTAFPVLARILTDRQLLHTKIGVVTITCAAVDDVTAWCLLAFVVSFVRASGIAQAVHTTILAALYIAVMFWVVRPLLRRVVERRKSLEKPSHNHVALVLLLLLASSWTTERIGIHGLFGAFLFGAVIPKEAAFAQRISEKLEPFVVIFLLPLFFAYSGLRTEVRLLSHPGAWAMCALITLVASAGKFGGSTLAARVTGLSWRESSAIGVLMNTRGLMELIVLNIGLDLGVLSPALFTMMVIMALLTTFMTTPILERIYPASELAKEIAAIPNERLVPRPSTNFA